MSSNASLVLLSAILGIAVLSDLRSHRIPNALNLAGLVAALLLQTFTFGLHGLMASLLGACVGLVCFAPLYVLKGMGAGDVKLLGAVGAVLGPLGAFYAAAASLMAGGLGAILYVTWCAARASISHLVQKGPGAAGASALIAVQLARRDRLPFALPIAVGSMLAYGYLAGPDHPAAWLQGMFQ